MFAATPQPTPFVQEWNFSQRELDRDKTLRVCVNEKKLFELKH